MRRSVKVARTVPRRGDDTVFAMRGIRFASVHGVKVVCTIIARAPSVVFACVILMLTRSVHPVFVHCTGRNTVTEPR
jgi:hypothetical protein